MFPFYRDLEVNKKKKYLENCGVLALIQGGKEGLSLFVTCLTVQIYFIYLHKKLCWRAFGWISLVY